MLRSREIEVTGHVAQDGCLRCHSQRTMAWDRDVMLAVFNAGQAEVPARLAGQSITELQGALRAHWRDPAKASSADDFLAHEMEPDDRRNAARIEMATNRVADSFIQVDQPTGLGEDRFA
jgi:hypothetical protein